MSIHPYSTLFSRTVYNPPPVSYGDVTSQRPYESLKHVPKTTVGTNLQAFAMTGSAQGSVSNNPYQRPIQPDAVHLPQSNSLPPASASTASSSNTPPYFSTTSRAALDANTTQKRSASTRARPMSARIPSYGAKPATVTQATKHSGVAIPRPGSAHVTSHRKPFASEHAVPLRPGVDGVSLITPEQSQQTQTSALVPVVSPHTSPIMGSARVNTESGANQRNERKNDGLNCSISPSQGPTDTSPGPISPFLPSASPTTHQIVVRQSVQPQQSGLQSPQWTMAQARVWWLERQRELLQSKAEERDEAVETAMRQKLVIDDTQRLVASLRSDNEHLTLALAAMMRGREEDVDRLIAEVKSRFERHRAMLMEDNRVLAATHREDVEKIKALTAVAAERAEEIATLTARLNIRDQDTAHARETATSWEGRHEYVSAHADQLREDKSALQIAYQEQLERVAVLETQNDGLRREQEEIERARATLESLLVEERQGRERAEHERRLSEASRDEAWASARASEDRARSTDEIVRAAKAQVVRETEKRQEALQRAEAAEARETEVRAELKICLEALALARAQAAAAEATASAVTRERDEAVAAKTALEQENVSLRTERAGGEASAAMLRDECANSKAREADLRLALAKVREELAHVRGQVDSSQRAAAAAEERAKVSEDKAHAAVQQSAEAAAVALVSKQRVEEAQARVAELVSAKTLLEHDAASRARELRAITKQYVSLHGEYSGVRAELASVRAQLHAQQQQQQQVYSRGPPSESDGPARVRASIHARNNDRNGDFSSASRAPSRSPHAHTRTPLQTAMSSPTTPMTLNSMTLNSGLQSPGLQSPMPATSPFPMEFPVHVPAGVSIEVDSIFEDDGFRTRKIVEVDGDGSWGQ